MLILLLSLAFAVEEDITVCYRSCPNSIKGTRVIVFKADDIASKIKPLLSDTKTNIYFHNATKFIFPLDLEIFQGYTIEFRKLDESKTVALEIDCTDSSKYIEAFTFKNIYVNFYSSLKIPQLNLQNLEIEQTQIDLFSIDPKLVVETLISDKSMKVFQSVDVSSSSSESSGITLKAGSGSSLTTQTIDNGAVLTYDKATTTFSFDESLSQKRFNLKEATFCEIEYKCSEISKLIQFSIANINTLSFVNSWPNTAVIDVENSTTLCANSTVLPVSLKSSSNSMIIVTQTDTTITGDVLSPVTFSCSKSDNQNRKTITFSKSFGGSSLDLGSSFLDITISNLITDISGSGTFPFSFKIGEGGISTLTVLSCGASSTQKSEISVKPDFTSYLSDEKLQNLLAKDWTILTLTGVTFLANQINVILPNEPFIHGFVRGDSCISSRITENKVVLSATQPSLLPLKICYDGRSDGSGCNSDESIKIESLDSFSSYFVDGVKNIQLHLKTSQTLSLNLQSNIQNQKDLEVILIGYDGTSLQSIQMNENSAFSHLKLSNLALGTTTFSVKEVTFKGCKIIESPTFSFINCERLNCDDDFLTLISPHISSQGGSKIKTIAYKMEKFNSVSISDTKFIFNEIESNQNKQSSELSRNVFDFLDLFYDVGKNDALNLTMETKNPPSFNVTFVNEQTATISKIPELFLFSWSQTKEANFLAYFNHEQIDAKIILTSRYRPNQLIPIGTGILLYETKYFYSATICSAPESDKGICPQGSIYTSHGQLNDKLGEINDENVMIYIKSTIDNCPSIDLSNINEKLTLFSGLSNDLKDCISVRFTSNVNVDLTDTEFNHIIVKKDSQTESKKLNLGNMKFYDVEIDSTFEDVDATLNDLHCEFRHFSRFKTVSILNDLTVNGSLSSDQSTVQFLGKEKSNRLTAIIDSDTSLVVSKKCLKIGQTKFEFNSLANGYDIVLDFEKSANKILINKDDDSSLSEIPSIEFRKTSSASFSFSNDWNSKPSNKAIFLFSHLVKNNVYLAGEKTPVSFTNCGELSLISGAEKAGIVGPIEFEDSSSLTVLYEKVTKSTLSVSQKITVGSTFDLKFKQPNIVFDVVEIDSNADESIIQTESFSNVEGDSLLVVHNEMKSATFSPVLKLQIPVKSDVSDKELANYFTMNHRLIKVNPSNIEKVKIQSIELIGSEPTSPGISEENIKINIDQSTGEISFKFKENPISNQITLCYEFNDDSCKSVLTEENIDEIVNLLPSGKSEIKVIFGKQNTKPLNLDVGKIKGSTVFIQQKNSEQLSIQVRLGHGIISLLSLDKVDLKVSDSSTFEIDRIELLNGAKFDQIEKIDLINIDYNSQWKSNPIEPCNKHLILNLTDSSSLTITKDGFVVNSDSEISSSLYPNLAFQLTKSSLITLDLSNDVPQSKEITIHSDTNRFVLGSNWASTSSSELRIKIEFGKDVKTNDISVITKSFPFVQILQLMAARTIQIDSSVLPYEVEKSATFDNMHSTLDFSHVQNQGEKAKVTFKSLVFKGSSSLSASGIKSSELLDDSDFNDFPLVVQNLEVRDDSLVTLSNVLIKDSLVIEGDSILIGNFEATNYLNMKWKLNKIPKIIINSDTNKLPQKIEFTFDESSIKGNENEYNEFLYGRSFEIIKVRSKSNCEDLKSVFSFVSPKVAYFGSESIFDVECNNGNLIVDAERYIKKTEKKKLSNAVLYSIIAICCIIVIAVIILVIIIFLRRNPNKDIDSSSIVSSTLLAY